MSPEKDYTRCSFRITLLVVIALVGISFIPPFTVGGVYFKRANIISDIYTFDDQDTGAEAGLNALDREFVAEGERNIDHAPGQEIDPVPQERADAEIVWNIHEGQTDEEMPADENGNGHFPSVETGEVDDTGIIKFEDFTSGGSPSVSDFSRLLGTASRNRVVRIAFLGDSYIEGDIITGDVREQLQDRYSGHGVGFVAFGTPLATARATVSHTFSGWTNYNLINKRTTPEQYKDKYTINGVLSIPGRGASSTYKGVTIRKHLSEWSRARLIFINEGVSSIKVTVNDTIENVLTPPASDQIQQINLSGAGMKKLKVTLERPDGFVGYGVVLEGKSGISVDNYSIRSNSGLAMFGTDSRANSQFRNIMGYDMIVLQYGLNAMDPNNTNYKAYGEQLRKVINYMKSCFPRSTIVLMGVGDRSTQRDGNFVTMSAVHAMIKEQRAAAEDCGIAFWNTFEAMGGQNSMAKFVQWNWAAKDYTHLSYRGGKHIATKFVDALEYEKQMARLADAQAERDAQAPSYSRGISIDIDLNAIYGQEDESPSELIPETDEVLRAGGTDSLPPAPSEAGIPSEEIPVPDSVGAAGIDPVVEAEGEVPEEAYQPQQTQANQVEDE